MNSASFDTLMDMCSNLKIEYNEIKAQIKKNETRISEIENYIQSFFLLDNE